MEKIITQFNKNGYAIISILDSDQLLYIKNLIKERIIDLLEINSANKNKINLEQYHRRISDNNHSIIVDLNNRYVTLNDRFNNTINNNISINKILFHLWKNNNCSIKWIGSYLLQKELLDKSCAFRIARPYTKYKNDVGGVHLDLHYGGKIRTNILALMTLWIPIIGFNEKYSLRIAPGSHKKQHPAGEIIKQNEYVSPVMNKNYTKKFSYIRPRLKIGEGILLHPNLLHGESYNHGVNTRISLDMRIFNEKFMV